jgi:hypothetical protein
MSDPRIKVSYLDAFPHNQDPIETVETLASPAKVWVFKLSGIHRKINLVKSGKQEHRD